MLNGVRPTKKILVVDDSSLMRRVMCDIINSDDRFEVVDQAKNGREALDLLSSKQYDAVVLDVNMPVMDGLTLLKELQRHRISARVMMASTDTKEGAKVTLDALELGALDFVHKPDASADCREDHFRRTFLDTLSAVVNSRFPGFLAQKTPMGDAGFGRKVIEPPRSVGLKGQKIVAIACSTGGPKALQAVIPKLPQNLNAPVVLVQHMPKGFTAPLAERLNGLSEIRVKEAAEGEVLQKGTVYVAMSGQHLNVKTVLGGNHVIHYSDEPPREGVKPCANYMYESLQGCAYDNIVCVVMTGMGADGTEGIRNLKQKKGTFVIAQDQDSCTVYGMPKSIVTASLADRTIPLTQIAQEIVMSVGR